MLSALILAVLIMFPFLSTVTGNPALFWGYQGTIEAPYPPVFTVTEPKNNTIFNKDTVSFSLNISIRLSEEKFATGGYVYRSEFLRGIYYTTDWLADEEYFEFSSHPNASALSPPRYMNYTFDLNLTDIPDGKHYVNFVANERGRRISSGEEYWALSTNASLTLGFTVDTTMPRVAITSIENKTYSYSDIPLIFNVDESAAEVLYVLDGKESVRGIGNTTLNGLPSGLHNVTVHVWDEAGNFGSSETVQFNVEAIPSVTSVLVVVFGVSAAFACVGVFLWKKTHRKATAQLIHLLVKPATTSTQTNPTAETKTQQHTNPSGSCCAQNPKPHN